MPTTVINPYKSANKNTNVDANLTIILDVLILNEFENPNIAIATDDVKNTFLDDEINPL